ncbi:MAG: DUF362 domain-containing protein, partial [Planctomycetota bacterium]
GGSRVVIARDEGVWAGEELRQGRVARLLDESVQRVTGKSTASAAWRELFTRTDEVAIKVNCLAGRRLSTGPELVEALVMGIQKAGVGPSQITVFERTGRELKLAGFELARGGGVQVVATDMRGLGYERRITSAGSVGGCFSRILTRGKTAVVSVPVLKDHDLAGVSVGMKNFYGVIHNPNKYHDNHCDPYVAELCTVPYIRDRLRLVVCDALLAQCHAGPNYCPPYAWKYSGLLVSTDPVALDAVGASVVEQERASRGLGSLEQVGRPPTWIRTATRLGLGEADLGAIEQVHV